MAKQAVLDKIAIPAGCLFCAIGILLGRFSGLGWTDFLAGMCLGLSVVFNIYGLHRYSRGRRLEPLM